MRFIVNVHNTFSFTKSSYFQRNNYSKIHTRQVCFDRLFQKHLLRRATVIITQEGWFLIWANSPVKPAERLIYFGLQKSTSEREINFLKFGVTPQKKWRRSWSWELYFYALTFAAEDTSLNTFSATNPVSADCYHLCFSKIVSCRVLICFCLLWIDVYYLIAGMPFIKTELSDEGIVFYAGVLQKIWIIGCQT